MKASPTRHYRAQRKAAEEEDVTATLRRGIWKKKCGRRASYQIQLEEDGDGS